MRSRATRREVCSRVISKREKAKWPIPLQYPFMYLLSHCEVNGRQLFNITMCDFSHFLYDFSQRSLRFTQPFNDQPYTNRVLSTCETPSARTSTKQKHFRFAVVSSTSPRPFDDRSSVGPWTVSMNVSDPSVPPGSHVAVTVTSYAGLNSIFDRT